MQYNGVLHNAHFDQFNYRKAFCVESNAVSGIRYVGFNTAIAKHTHTQTHTRIHVVWKTVANTRIRRFQYAPLHRTMNFV